MLARIQAFYQRYLQAQDSGESEQGEHSLRLAATALMIEVMRVDEHKSEPEINAVLNASMGKFGIDRQEAQVLMELAEAELGDATDYHQFTSLINRGYDPAQKRQIIEYLWQVAYADGELDKYEEHVIRKVADLIYVSHKEFIRLKEKVRLNNNA